MGENPRPRKAENPAARTRRPTGSRSRPSGSGAGAGRRESPPPSSDIVALDKAPRRGKRSASDSRRGRASSESSRRTARNTEELAARKRRQPVRMSIALKFSLPVCILIGAVISGIGVWAVGHMRTKLLNEIKKAGASGVMGLANLGRTMLSERQRYGPLWPVRLGLVDADTYGTLARKIETGSDGPPAAGDPGEAGTTGEAGEAGATAATAAPPPPPPGGRLPPEEIDLGREFEDEALAAEVRQFMARHGVRKLESLEKALLRLRLLEPWTHYFNEKGEAIPNEVLDAYIMDLNGYFVAGSRVFTGSVAIRRNNPWIEEGLSTVVIGTDTIRLAERQIEVDAGWITQNGQATKILVFTTPIHSKGTAGVLLGHAILALSAEVIEKEQARMRNLVLVIGGVAVILAAVICVMIASLVSRPVKMLVSDMNVVAQGNLDHRTVAHSNDEIGQMAVEFNEMTRRLLIAREAEKDAERLENELELAREIQMKLLPARIPAVKGFDMYAFYKPAKEVGGDYYDFFPIDKEHLGVIVADVSGKGIPGSMVMATTRTILRFIAAGNTSAADALAKTNAIINADIKRGMFVTAFYLVLDARRKSMVCASAGHNPMVVMRANGAMDLVNPNGIALGFDKGPIFTKTIKEAKIDVAPGDRVVLYTDGVVEAMNEENEEYTSERFYEFVRENAQMGSREFTDALLADLDRHKGKAEQHDDITIVTFKIL